MTATTTKLSWTKATAGKYTAGGIENPYMATKTGGTWTLTYAGDFVAECATYAQCRERAENHAPSTPTPGDSRNVPSDTDLPEMARELVSETNGPETGAAAVALARENAEEVAAGRGEQCDLYPETPAASPLANGAVSRGGQQTAPTMTAAEADRLFLAATARTGFDEVREVAGKVVVMENKTAGGFGLAAKLAAREEAAASGPPHVVVEALAGCLAADTIINVNRAGRGEAMTIEKLVKQFTGVGAMMFRSDTQTYQRMRPWNPEIPTMAARSVDGTVRLGRVKNAWFSGDKETFTVTTETGRNVRATAIHPFQMSDGTWKKLSELRVGDEVLVNVGRSKSCPSEKSYDYLGTVVNYHPNQVHGGGGYYSVPVHRAVVEAEMNGMSLDEFVKVLRTDMVRSETLKFLSRTQIVHHKNDDHRDNRINNLEVLDSQKEHSARHDWAKNVLWRIGTERILSIESFGVEPTYDIEMEDNPHNFLANGFVVHNTGKTTTLVGGIQTMLGLVPRAANGVEMVPSPQQKAVWDALAASRGANSVAFLAFNKAIAEELQKRLTGLRGVEAMTNHSLGMRAVNRAYRGLKVEANRVQDLICKVLGVNIYDLRSKSPVLLNATAKLVSLCKMNLSHVDPYGNTLGAGDPDWADVLTELAEHYDVDLSDERSGRDYRAEVFGLVPRVLDLCRDVDSDRKMDFDDMIWLPIALDLPVNRYDVVMVDEAQDLNRCQQALIKKAAGAGGRVVLCGDRNQAIYGFAGADSESLPRMTAELGGTPRGVTVLPLTVTRRCGRAIVKEAQRLVPAFEAHESNPDGEVRTGLYKDAGTRKSYRAEARDGDMIICRTNAPLVTEVFKFIRAGRKANIRGRDVGRGLVALVEKSKTGTVESFLAWLETWREKEVEKEMKKRHPSETKLTMVNDRADCLVCFAAELDVTAPVRHLTDKIESVFTDDKNAPGVCLSSIHKAKGLEADRVVILRGKAFGAKKEWMAEQERNLTYVAITRAVRTLTFVDLPGRDDEE